MQDEKEFTLPVSSKKVVLRGYVTGRIDAEVQAILSESIDIQSNIDEDSKTSGGTVRFSATGQRKATQKAMELMLVSLDGDSTNVYERVLDLPVGDTDFITEKVNAITEASKVSDSKKKS